MPSLDAVPAGPESDPPDPGPDPTRPTGAVPTTVRVAGALVGLEGLAALAFGIVLLVRALTGADGAGGLGYRVAEAAFFALVAAVLVAIGVGLVRGRRGTRSPAIVFQVLLLPVVYTMLGPSRQVALGAVAGVLVVGCLLLLIAEPSRRWVVGEPSDEG